MDILFKSALCEFVCVELSAVYFYIGAQGWLFFICGPVRCRVYSSRIDGRSPRGCPACHAHAHAQKGTRILESNKNSAIPSMFARKNAAEKNAEHDENIV